MLWEPEIGTAILKMSSSLVTYLGKHINFPDTWVSDDDIPQGMQAWVEEDASIWQWNTSHHVPSYKCHTRAWCTGLKKPFIGPAAALVAAEGSWHGELPKVRKPYATITSQCLWFRASAEAFFLPSSHPAPTAASVVPFPSHFCQAAAAASTVSASSCPCLGCCCCFSLDSCLGQFCHWCSLQPLQDPTWPHGDKSVCTHLPTSGSGVPTPEPLVVSLQWMATATSDCICGVWRFERTQCRTYYYLLLMLSAE